MSGWPSKRVAIVTGANRGIGVYAVCPGWARTGPGEGSAPRTPEQGAETIVWLAASEPAPGSGRFYRDRERLAW